MTTQVSPAFFLLYTGGCFLVAIIGINRNIGYWRAFFLSLILSPLFGGIIALLSERKVKEKIIVANQEKETKSISVADEIKKYQDLKNSGAITEEEFLKIKSKLLNN